MAHETDLIEDVIEHLNAIGNKDSEYFVEQLARFRQDLLFQAKSGEEHYANGLRQGEARAWNAMRNFVAMSGDDTRLTSADLMDRLGDKLAAASGDPEHVRKNVEDISKVLLRKALERLK